MALFTSGAAFFRSIEEAGKMDESKSSLFWVSSGAYFNYMLGEANTVHGSLQETNRWRLLYAKNNPKDTDQGFHPQNIFRLVIRRSLQDISFRFSFLISKTNLSKSENRNESNGVLAFLRYNDQNNLYYAGIRVDGRPVIKKKFGGTYHTLSYPPNLFPGVYSREASPNLIPQEKWFGLKATVRSEPSCAAKIELFFYSDGVWQKVADACDNGDIAGPPFKEGLSGIRTDFMDVKFRNIHVGW